jgi:hypothetical protein
VPDTIATTLMRAARRLSLALVVLVLGACGSPPASAPSATASVRPSAAASSAGIPVPAILAGFRDPAFAFDAPMSGEINVAGKTFSVLGQSSFRGDDSYSLLILDTPSGRQRTERIIAAGKTYTRSTETGPWFGSPGTTDSGNWGLAFRTVRTLTERSRLNYNGKEAHAFVTDDGALTASQLGIPTKGVASFAGAVTLFVDDPGNLLGFVVDAAWLQAGPGGAAIDASMSLDYSVMGNDPKIAAPDEVWTRVTSTRFGYSIGYPVDMQVTEGTGNKPDVFRYPDMFAVIARESAPGNGLLSTYVTTYIAASRRDMKVDPESQTDIVMAGHPGKALRYRFGAGHDQYAAVGLTVNGRNAYFVALFGHRGDEKVVDALLAEMIATFAIAGL